MSMRRRQVSSRASKMRGKRRGQRGEDQRRGWGGLRSRGHTHSRGGGRETAKQMQQRGRGGGGGGVVVGGMIEVEHDRGRGIFEGTHSSQAAGGRGGHGRGRRSSRHRCQCRGGMEYSGNRGKR